MPGGTCQFDLPGYHFWLTDALERRQQDLQTWSEEVEPLRAALAMLLTMIRGSATPVREQATQGMYQQTLEGGVSGQLIRIIVPAELEVFPEVSASRHRITIRFMTWPDLAERPQQTEQDIVFGLTYCQL
jgi:cell division protein ZapD